MSSFSNKRIITFGSSKDIKISISSSASHKPKMASNALGLAIGDFKHSNILFI